MTHSRVTSDPIIVLQREMRELRRQLLQLAVATPQEHATISRGQTRVKVSKGIEATDDGTLAAGDADLSAANGGTVRAGNTSVRADDGKLRNTSGTVTVAGGLRSDGEMYGAGGVRTPWQGGSELVEPLIVAANEAAAAAAADAAAARSAADSAAAVANSGVAAAATAQSTADAARARADAAYELAEGAGGGSRDFSDLPDFGSWPPPGGAKLVVLNAAGVAIGIINAPGAGG